jgi:hypothetical protein
MESFTEMTQAMEALVDTPVLRAATQRSGVQKKLRFL